jgi:hypothetical protein
MTRCGCYCITFCVAFVIAFAFALHLRCTFAIHLASDCVCLAMSWHCAAIALCPHLRCALPLYLCFSFASCLRCVCVAFAIQPSAPLPTPLRRGSSSAPRCTSRRSMGTPRASGRSSRPPRTRRGPAPMVQQRSTMLQSLATRLASPRSWGRPSAGTVDFSIGDIYLGNGRFFFFCFLFFLKKKKKKKKC